MSKSNDDAKNSAIVQIELSSVDTKPGTRKIIAVFLTDEQLVLIDEPLYWNIKLMTFFRWEICLEICLMNIVHIHFLLICFLISVDLILNTWFLARNHADITSDSKEKPSGLDATDKGCVGCSEKDSDQNKESISLSSSSDDESSDQAMSLNMSKKSTNIGYKGKYSILVI